MEPEKPVLRRPAPENVQPLDAALADLARKELAADLKSPASNLRVHAIEAEKETLGLAAKDDFLRALNGGMEFERYASAMAVGELQIKEARPALLRLVDDKNVFVRIAARFALHRLGDYTYSHDLETFSQDPDPRVRALTATVFGELEEHSAVKALTTLRKDSEPIVRQDASEALWRLGEFQGAEDLVGLLNSRYYDDEIIGILGLVVRRDARVRQHIRVELSSEAIQVRLVAARAMGMLGGGPYDIGLPIAMDGARDKDPKVRALAALALGAIGRTDEQAILRELLNDADGEVRLAAATAILQLTTPDKRPAEQG